MTVWEGWSTNSRQVDITRILKFLLQGAADGRRTTQSTSEALAMLDIRGIDAGQLAVQLANQFDLFNGGALSFEAGTDTLFLTPLGQRVLGEFEAMSAGRRRRAAARRAMLIWLDEHDGAGSPREMLAEPHSWFYGHHFTLDELEQAALNLDERDMVTTRRTLQAVVRAQITGRGTQCVERYDGDPDELERAVNAGVNIGNYTQHGGNTAIGSHDFTQTSTPVSAAQAAGDFADAIHAIREMGWIPVDQHEEADSLAVQLHGAAADESTDARPALSRMQRFVATVNEASNNPAIAPILKALGTSAAAWTGVSVA
jgi:hypothetical protein